MNLLINAPSNIFNTKLTIGGSKSETNRMLILQALYPFISFKNPSDADDCLVLKNALADNKNQININDSGTAMRFLTAYFATQIGRKVYLTGSKRMKERPIADLVEALKKLGANIEYCENFGVPPLLIHGKKIQKNKISLLASVSSQFISALLLISPKLDDGLELELLGKITSLPYINMTLQLLNQIGVKTSFRKNIIKVNKIFDNHSSIILNVESDWSSASYFYSILALSKIGTTLSLSYFKKNSIQGDSILVNLYKIFGVETTFKTDEIILKKINIFSAGTCHLQLKNAPDLAQTIAVTCYGLGINCHLKGLHTLKIKETDRLVALKTELEKLGSTVEITSDSLNLSHSNCSTLGVKNLNNTKFIINTYDDHRMAMSFAPLALKFPVIINNPNVVSKSYPDFWKDLEKIGFKCELV